MSNDVGGRLKETIKERFGPSSPLPPTTQCCNVECTMCFCSRNHFNIAWLGGRRAATKVFLNCFLQPYRCAFATDTGATRGLHRGCREVCHLPAVASVEEHVQSIQTVHTLCRSPLEITIQTTLACSRSHVKHIYLSLIHI